MTKDKVLHRVLTIAGLVLVVVELACLVAYFAWGHEFYWIILACLALSEAVQWGDRRVEKRLGIPSFDERIEALRKAQEREEAGVA